MNHRNEKQKGVRRWMPLLLALACMATLISRNASAAVTYLGTDSGESGGSGATFSFAINIHADTELVVGIGQTSQGMDVERMVLEGGTGGNVDLIQLSATKKEAGKNERISMFYLVNPPKNATACRVYFAEDKKGQTGGLAYYKGVDLGEPIGKNIGIWSDDPFNEQNAILGLSDLPLGCSVITGLSANRGDVKIKDAVAGSDYLTGGGTIGRLWTRWPSSSSFIGGIVSSGLADIVVPPASGQFTGPVNPNWNSYSGNGTAAVVVVNPTKSTINYAASPANGGTFSGGAPGVLPGTGSTSFTVAANPGFSHVSTNATNGNLGGAFPNFTLSSVTASSTTVTATFNPIMRTVSYPAVANGTVTGNTSVQDTVGTVALTVTPATGYMLSGQPTATSGQITGSGSSWTLSNVKANTQVTATFVPIMHAVNYNVGANGSYEGPAEIQDTIADVDITIAADAGYELNGLPSASTGTFVHKAGNVWTLSNVTQAVTITANFQSVFHTVGSNVITTTPAGEGLTGGTIEGLAPTIQDTVGTAPFTTVPATGYKLSGTPTASGGATITGTAPNFTLTNVTQDTVITATFVNNRPTIQVFPTSASVECGNEYTLDNARFGVQANDPEDGTINPLSLTIVPSVPFPFTEIGEYTITYDVMDKAGLAALQVTRTVTIADSQAPVITMNGDPELILQCSHDGEYVDAGATADDLCEGSVAVDSSSNVDVTQAGTYQVVYTAQDSGGREATATRTVIVEDNDAPELQLVGDEIDTAFLGIPYVDEGALAIDACDGTVPVVATGAVDTNTPGTYTLYYNYTDNSGNAAEEITRSVQVVSLDNPSVMNVEVESEFTVIVTWNKAISLMDAALVAGNYTVSGNGAGTLSANPTSVEAKDATSVRLIWTDAGEMLNGRSVVITVDSAFEDNYDMAIEGTQGAHSSGGIGIAPVITLNGDAAQTLECGIGEYEELNATAFDNVDGDVAVVVSGEVDSSAIDDYEITYTATDAAGNVGIAVRTVSVVDLTAPDIEVPGDANIDVPCGYPFADPGLSAFDACEGDLTDDVAVSGDTVDTSVPGAVYTLNYQVTDSSGNSSPVVVRTVTIVDQEGPDIFITGDNPLILDGADEYQEYGAVAIDACGDVDYTDDIVIDGEVNPFVIGVYEVTYTVSDGIGNTSTATRVVEVKRTSCTLQFVVEITPNPAIPGEMVTFFAKALASSCQVGELHFEWQKRSANKDDGFVAIPSADDDATFVIGSVDLDDSGDYRCIISDAMVVETSPVVTLSVGSGVPAASGVGLTLLAATLLAATAASLRKKRD